MHDQFERDRGEFERIRRVLADAACGEPMTAQEIHELLAAHGEEFGSSHRIATVLGRRADAGEVDVIRGNPYRYRIEC